MGRIEEALRRVRQSAAESPSEFEEQGRLTAWDISGTAEPKAGREYLESLRNAAVSRATGRVSFASEWRQRLALEPDGDPVLIEQFRRLAGVLHQAKQANGLRSVMVTSASPGDGKTLTAVNLSLVLADSYHGQVLLIDADLRRPSIPNVVDLGVGAGLSETLRAPSDQRLALVQVTPRLSVLPAGQPISNSLEALTSPRMAEILDEAASLFDWIVLDAPPVGPTADARFLTELVDGTLFVIHAGRSQCPDVQRSLESIGRENVLGIVLNGSNGAVGDGGYYGPTPTQ